MEKRIRVSTQGRITIPKQLRDLMKIEEGQAMIIRPSSERKQELILEVMSTMKDYTNS